ncbi:thiopurine S-methyltransferase [Hyalangium minutum]|uniref:Thiopurine S-methyltransferase n=1 Tax=Hyalangium minutum TaxID=394096 RepID=A0A085WKZ7_9BACT|nr:thiopurine S-methyltransferase [Hyalangium minutum]KFE68360.1 Thiopurine S-methyltransferase [Hyalangium minutum]
MESQFWHERWQQGQIAFHQPEVEKFLGAHFERLGLARGATVFVPLCGKSLDMLWLVSQGYQVVGVELSPIACEAFFSENRIEAATPVTEGPFRVHRAKHQPITLYEGDFFQLSARQTGPLAAFYDRASLIALPPAMRERYAEHFQREMLAPSTSGLLLTVAYQSNTFPGPPFSIPSEEVHRLWGERFQLEQVGQGEEVVGPPTQRISTAKSAWLLTPKAGR